MEGEAAVLQVLVQNLIDLCKKEISQIRGLDKDAAKLAGSLKTIQNFLTDAEKRDITSEAVKNWLEKLENEAFDADNVLDELNYHILSKQSKPAEPKKSKDYMPKVEEDACGYQFVADRQSISTSTHIFIFMLYVILCYVFIYLILIETVNCRLISPFWFSIKC